MVDSSGHFLEKWLIALKTWLSASPWVLLSIVVSIALISVAGNVEADPDLFARVAVGKLFSEVGFQMQDPFSFAPKKTFWVDHEWLSGVFFYQISQFAGDFGLLLCRYLFISATFYFLFKAASLFSNSNIAFFSCALAAMQTTYIWATTIRSQVFTYLFLAYFLWAVARSLRLGCLRALYAFPLILLIWQQSHGGVVVGLGLFAVFVSWGFIFLPSQRRTLLILALASGLTLLLTPYGPVVFWSYIIEATQMPRPSIPEWNALSIVSTFAIGLHIFLVLCLVGFFMKKKNAQDLLLLAFLFLSCFYAIRHQRLVALFCFVAAACGSVYIAAVFAFMERSLPRLTTLTLRSAAPVVVGLGLCSSLLFCIHILRFKNLRYSDYPVQAMHWLTQATSGGNLLVDFNNGSFAMWAGYPKFLVSLDGRYEELYEEATLALVTTALQPKQKGHKQALSTLNPDYILQDCLKQNPCPDYDASWQKVYADERFRVFTKDLAGVSAASENSSADVRMMWHRPSYLD